MHLHPIRVLFQLYIFFQKHIFIKDSMPAYSLEEYIDVLFQEGSVEFGLSSIDNLTRMENNYTRINGGGI